MIIPEIQATERPYKGKLIAIELDTLTRDGGEPFVREIAVVTEAVGIVAIDEQERVLLVKQYRHAIRGPLWEIPAGRMDVAGEMPEQTAARELREEADVVAEQLELLTVFSNSAGWTNEKTHIFSARGLAQVAEYERFNEEADIEKAWIPLPEALAMIKEGTIDDAKTIIGILLVQ